MARRTTITHPDGSTTTIVTRSGCGQGCSLAFWFMVGLFVVLYPAESFPSGQLSSPTSRLQALGASWSPREPNGAGRRPSQTNRTTTTSAASEGSVICRLFGAAEDNRRLAGSPTLQALFLDRKNSS